MMNKNWKKSCCGIFALAAMVSIVATSRAQSTVVQVDAGKTISKVSPKLYGLMTEEINYSYDGGLYGELIRNRIFQDKPLTGRNAIPGQRDNPAVEKSPNLVDWSLVNTEGSSGEIDIDTNDPVNTVALKNSLKLSIKTVAPGQRVGIANVGYWGIPVRPNTEYTASFYARAGDGFNGPLTVSIEPSAGGEAFAAGRVPAITNEWRKYTVKINTGGVKPTADARFVISAASPGTVWFSLVSLFPPTFNNRPNGNRIDLMQKLVDMKPTFLRFPGGNYLEGNDFANRFNWKETIGDISQRPGHMSPWNYRSTDGMGLLEFLEWAEDMHAEPVLGVFAGFTLGGTFVATGDELKPFVQDALDEIEYVTGDASTKWGAQRIKDGHPQPFPLTYVEVGNEDNLGGGARTYDERYTAFYDAIKAKYPQIQVIATTSVRSRVADVIDEHSYMSADAAMQQAHRFDGRSRDSQTKIFMGEWATRVGSPTTNLQAGLSDAAFMTGLERNSDIVIMSCYAPLFVNVNPGGMQWRSDLIGFDALTSYGCPSYYVQKMFSDYLGDTLVQLTLTDVPTRQVVVPARRGRGAASSPSTAPNTVNRELVYSSVTKNSSTGEIYLKLVNCDDKPQPVQIKINGVGSVGAEAKAVVLSSAAQTDTNTITEPTKIVPVESKITGVSTSFSHTLPANSFTVLQIESH